MNLKQKAMLQEVATKLVENAELFYWGSYTTECGTMHCVAGWLPVWYPDDWTRTLPDHVSGSHSHHLPQWPEFTWLARSQ